MKKTHALLVMLMGFFVGLPGTALAHSPFCLCEKDDGKIVCKGGFSDGSSAAGVQVDLISGKEEILKSQRFDELSSACFAIPEGDFYILMDAGLGHTVEVERSAIAGM